MSYKAKDVLNGVVWSAIDKFAVVGIQLVVEIFMARLLVPKDYGIIGMVAVFIAIAQVFVDSGFSNALIQKKDRSEVDYSTVFYFNVGIAFLVYAILFVAAPYISNFYNTDITAIIRIISLGLVFNSFIVVHRTKLSVSLNFKVQAKLSLIAVLISGTIGLILAHLGFGVWSLVYQSIALAFFTTVFFLIKLKWIPLLVFSKESFNSLFYFGSKLLLSSLIQALYFNTYTIIIGKKYPTADLGLYSKANQFTMMPVSMLTSVLQRVAFPFLSTYQDDNKKLFSLNLEYTRIICLLFFSVFFGVVALAEPIVTSLLSTKWIEIVPVIRVLAVAFTFYPLININMMLFQIKGKTTLFLKIEIITKIIGITILVLTYNHGLIAICYGILLQHILQLLITSYISSKILLSNFLLQIKVIIPIMLTAILISGVVFILTSLFAGSWYKLGIGLFLFLLFYSTFALFFLRKDINKVIDLFK